MSGSSPEISMSVSPLISTLAGIAVGAVITWLVARHYYSHAARDLMQETSKLRHLTTMVLRSLENAGLVELNRDKSGEITGLVVTARVSLTGRGSLRTKAEVIHRKSGNADI